MAEVTSLTAVEMARRIRSREISAGELAEAHLRRIERLQPKLNAFVTIDFDGARRQAVAADEAVARGASLGPLRGVPVTIKSSIDVKGLRCESGTKLREGNIAETDAPLVARLRRAGAIILGNTNVPELLMAYETDNVLYGRTNSPWDLARTPGGSSGGEAAAIAARCSAGGIGSDGGGSVRVPAHFSGICGLKPTPGRIPSTGHFPASAGPFAQLGVVGPMARSVADLRLLFEVVAGPDFGDPCFAPAPMRWPSGAETRELCVGYFEDDGRTPVTPETRAAVRAAASLLKQQGFAVEPFFPQGLEEARRLWWTLFGLAGSLVLGPMLQGREAQLSPILKEFKGFVEADPPLTLHHFMNALLERDALRARFLAQMEVFPILLCPVAAIPAFRHRERTWTIEGKNVEYLDAWSYSQWFNLLGNPGAVVPMGKSSEGLPIGVQIVGRPWEEEAVLTVAAKLEEARGDFPAPAI